MITPRICQVAVLGGGVAGLATALNILDQTGKSGGNLRVTVFEADATPGGNLRTLHQDGWQLEWGANGFLDSEPATLRLVRRLGLAERLLPSSDATRHRFLLVNGRLEEIPTSPKAFLKSGMLPPGAKLRMAGELFLPARRNLGRAAEEPATDETIYEFGRRRLGREFAEVMLDPMVKGIFGGDARQLSLAAAFPRMVELEKNHGGLFRAMIALARRRKKGHKTDAGPSGTLTSFQGGMADLVAALERTIGQSGRAEIRCDSPVETLTREQDTWHVSGPGFSVGPFDAVVDATPAHTAARHLTDVAPGTAAELARIPFAPIAVVALGFDREAVGHNLNSFGLLVPSREKRDILGCLLTSSIFPGRAPDGKVLLRAMVGGATNPTVMDLDDEHLANLTLSELRPMLHLKGAPIMVRIIRHPRGIAQYLPGHLALLRQVGQDLERLPGLFLTGSSYRGIAVNACVKEAEALGRNVTRYIEGLEGCP
ncbi:protoporphyrinogen oxidase [bacterium DOLJORAL78_65_58]|nr:MAG: protoporphyrinogen oxidase [bacterium DOLZORAL124_64_63]PIE76017.1 MAG: protoporphyrinogen oxidase [bacterium DOLJORAL78_65_58]